MVYYRLESSSWDNVLAFGLFTATPWKDKQDRTQVQKGDYK